MATWLRRPIIPLLRPELSLGPHAELCQEHLGDGTLAPQVLHARAHGPPHGFAYSLPVPAPWRNAFERAIDDVEQMLKYAFPGGVKGRHAVKRNCGVGQQLPASGERDGNNDDDGK